MGALAGTLRTFEESLAALQGISRSITSVGLNAAVKSFRIGADGRGLAVIAQHLRTYAEQIVDDTEALIVVFRDVMRAAKVVEGSRNRQDADRMAAADAEIVSMLRTIGQNEAFVADAFAAMARSGPRVAELVRQAEDAFVTLAADMAPATDAVATLGKLGQGGRLAAPANAAYTMSREREIHARLALSQSTEPAVLWAEAG